MAIRGVLVQFPEPAFWDGEEVDLRSFVRGALMREIERHRKTGGGDWHIDCIDLRTLRVTDDTRDFRLIKGVVHELIA